MAQPPLQLDALQIIGDSGIGTRTIDSDATDGSMVLTDAVLTAGIKISRLPGLPEVDNVFLVGKGGLGVGKDATGASYNTIQAALDDIPTSKNKDNRALVLVSAGTYVENLTIEKDGIEIRGLGGVIIRNTGAVDTITVVSGVGIPLFTVLQDLQIENTNDNNACLRLTGGVGSTVAQFGVSVLNCDLLATGLSGFQINSDTVNKVRVRGGSWAGGNTSALCRVDQTAEFDLRGVSDATRFLLAYTNVGSVPFLTTSAYRIWDSDCVGTFSSTLTGVGSLEVRSSKLGQTTLGGDRPVRMTDSQTVDLTVNDTLPLTFVGGTHGTLTGSATSSIAERLIEGTITFTASASETVTFAVPNPDSNYTVSLDSELVVATISDVPSRANKTATAFDITFPVSVTTTVRFSVAREIL